MQAGRQQQLQDVTSTPRSVPMLTQQRILHGGGGPLGTDSFGIGVQSRDGCPGQSLIHTHTGLDPGEDRILSLDSP